MSPFMQANLDFLRALAELRTPLLDTLMALVTHLGEETLFMVIALAVFWCVDKRRGYYLLLVGFGGTVINQALKITFRIPRPWVLDPEFQIVEAARAQATGFSFPSGHTQNAVGTLGGLARTSQRLWVRVVCVAIALTVAFSRLYLGVHTPLDVGVSLLVAATLVFALAPALEEAKRRPHYMLHLWLVMLIPTALYLLYALHVRAGLGGTAELDSAVKNGWNLLGAVLGIVVTILVDEHYTRFETGAVWWAQLLKLALGLALVVAVRSGLKAPLRALFGANSVGDSIRYFCMVLMAGVLWPMSFRWFARLGGRSGLGSLERGQF